MTEPSEVRRLGKAQTPKREQADLAPRCEIERFECGATFFRVAHRSDRRAGLLNDALAGSEAELLDNVRCGGHGARRAR
ncbi:hypothetical protein WMF27_30335 [Sorangium sp. So ce281]|uniref:hypothetical protein n=1 Tax=unclassified Sorangium TaxID=2621164 RepID=UPI003F608252